MACFAGCSLPARGEVEPEPKTFELDSARYQRSGATIAMEVRDYVVRRSLGCTTSANPSAEIAYLMLSGGGEKGAFGAGILSAWEQGAGPARGVSLPAEFDVVTGVSVGALQSSFAFLGDRAAMSDMREACSGLDDDQLVERRSLLRQLRSSGLTSVRPLERLITRLLPDARIDAIAQKADRMRAEDRFVRLYVGTVDLDTGAFTAWDMLAIARDRNHDLYRKVILASAAVPFLMDPVYIERRMHVDGSTRLETMLPGFLDGMSAGQAISAARRAVAAVSPLGRTRATHRARRVRSRIFVVINGYTSSAPALHVAPDGLRLGQDPWILWIGLRATDLLLEDIVRATLRDVAAAVRPFSLGREPDCELYVATIAPDIVKDAHAVGKYFDQGFMARLFEEGTRVCREGNWEVLSRGLRLPIDVEIRMWH